jgi:hypothetical protein
MIKAAADQLLYNEAQNEIMFVKYFENARAAFWQQEPNYRASLMADPVDAVELTPDSRV